jgi:phosphoserine phosphatase
MAHPLQKNNGQQIMGTEVFDFDKTLTYRDTTLPLFCHQQTTARRVAIYLAYYGLAVLVKGKLIHEADLKMLLLRVFFAAWEAESWERHCAAFAGSIATNGLYAQTDWETGDKWVVSASFEAVVRPLFPAKVTVIGSKVYKIKGRWQWGQHAFGKSKAILLKNAGVNQVMRVYTDSKSDRYMMAMAAAIVWVRGDKTSHFTRQEWELKHGALPKV